MFKAPVIVRSALAVLRGAQLCFTESTIRKLCFWPWAIGALSYFFSLIAAYHLHQPLLNSLIEKQEGFWQLGLYYLAWFAAALMLLVISLVFSISVVMVFTSVFQTKIAILTLDLNGARITQEEGVGVLALLKETKRTAIVETTKLIWLLPLILASVIVGFIPFLTPFAIIFAAWLLAYQFIDIVLDIFKLTALERFFFACRHAVTLIAFGLTLTCAFAIPLLGLFLPPVAVAGAAWLLSDQRFKSQIKKIS